MHRLACGHPCVCARRLPPRAASANSNCRARPTSGEGRGQSAPDARGPWLACITGISAHANRLRVARADHAARLAERSRSYSQRCSVMRLQAAQNRQATRNCMCTINLTRIRRRAFTARSLVCARVRAYPRVDVPQHLVMSVWLFVCIIMCCSGAAAATTHPIMSTGDDTRLIASRKLRVSARVMVYESMSLCAFILVLRCV